MKKIFILTWIYTLDLLFYKYELIKPFIIIKTALDFCPFFREYKKQIITTFFSAFNGATLQLQFHPNPCNRNLCDKSQSDFNIFHQSCILSSKTEQLIDLGLEHSNSLLFSSYFWWSSSVFIVQFICYPQSKPESKLTYISLPPLNK